MFGPIVANPGAAPGALDAAATATPTRSKLAQLLRLGSLNGRSRPRSGHG
jgi:hypothetical protein